MTQPDVARPGALQLLARFAPSLVALVLVWGLIEALHHGLGQRPAADAALHLERGRFLGVGAERPPGADGAPWVEVALPDDWGIARPELRQGWYELRVELPRAPEDVWGLYWPSLNTGSRTYVNGRYVGDGGRFKHLRSHSWHVPLYMTLPEGTLRAGTNLVQVRVDVARPGFGYVDAAWLGPEPAVRPAFERRQLFQVTSVQLVAVALAVFGVALIGVLALRRDDPLYGWGAGLMLAWAAGLANLLAFDSTLPTPSWEVIGVASPFWLAALSTGFAHCFFGMRRPRLDRALLVAAALVTLAATATLGSAAFVPVRIVANLATLVVAVYAGALVVRGTLRRDDVETGLLMAGGVLLFASAVHDVMLVNDVIGGNHDFSIQWVAIADLGLFAAVLVRRFVRALQTSELLTRDLEQRVADKHRELEANFARVRELEVERSTAQERERIMRDIHDGMGAQLVSTLALVRSGRADLDSVSDALQDALADLRMVVNSLAPDETDLLAVLGLLRARLEPRIRAAGLELRWRVEDLPDGAIGPQATLQLIRIVQEAIGNALKHAGASALTLRTGLEDADRHPAAFVEIEDDGVGFAPDSVSTSASGGRGLQHMRQRADSIGATLTLSTSASGTRIRVRLPLG